MRVPETECEGRQAGKIASQGMARAQGETLNWGLWLVTAPPAPFIAGLYL